MIIEDGRIRWFGARPRTVSANYRIVEDHVLARVEDGGVIEIDLARERQGEEAIDVTMPGTAAARHGVRCR